MALNRPAARMTDLHSCPMVAPAATPIIGVCALNVLIGGLPAARVGDVCACVPAPDPIVTGAWTVLIAGMPAARVLDQTAAGGLIATGQPTVLIG